ELSIHQSVEKHPKGKRAPHFSHARNGSECILPIIFQLLRRSVPARRYFSCWKHFRQKDRRRVGSRSQCTSQCFSYSSTFAAADFQTSFSATLSCTGAR